MVFLLQAGKYDYWDCPNQLRSIRSIPRAVEQKAQGMTLETLVKELETILKVHPNAKDAIIWAENSESYHSRQYRIGYVRLNGHTHPTRIIFEEGL